MVKYYKQACILEVDDYHNWKVFDHNIRRTWSIVLCSVYAISLCTFLCSCNSFPVLVPSAVYVFFRLMAHPMLKIVS